MMLAKKYCIISHHIFLTREQRYKIARELESIEVMGVSSPMMAALNNWESPTHEIFCSYQVTPSIENDPDTVYPKGDGYTITLTGNMPKYLLDIKDHGSESLIFTHRNQMWIDGKQTIVVHIVQIEDASIIEESIC